MWQCMLAGLSVVDGTYLSLVDQKLTKNSYLGITNQNLSRYIVQQEYLRNATIELRKQFVS